MAETVSEPLDLDPVDWLDAPQAAVAALLARADGGPVIDAASAGPIPAQIAQLLLAARASAAESGQRLRIERPSLAVVQSLAALGLTDLLTETAQ